MEFPFKIGGKRLAIHHISGGMAVSVAGDGSAYLQGDSSWSPTLHRFRTLREVILAVSRHGNTHDVVQKEIECWSEI